MGDKWGAPQPRSEERREESTPPPLAPRSRPQPTPGAHPAYPSAPQQPPAKCTGPGRGKRPRRARACSRRTCLAFCPEAGRVGWASPVDGAAVPTPPTLSIPKAVSAPARPSQARASRPLPRHPFPATSSQALTQLFCLHPGGCWSLSLATASF